MSCLTQSTVEKSEENVQLQVCSLAAKCHWIDICWVFELTTSGTLITEGKDFLTPSFCWNALWLLLNSTATMRRVSTRDARWRTAVLPHFLLLLWPPPHKQMFAGFLLNLQGKPCIPSETGLGRGCCQMGRGHTDVWGDGCQRQNQDYR